MSSFLSDLDKFGPTSLTRAPSEQESKAYCASLTRRHYENFSVVTWLTPPALRPAFEAVYAFCRWSDDLGDEVGDRQRSTQLLSWWRGELHRLFDQNKAAHPVYQALRPIIAEYDIPIAPFEALISAFEQDQVVTNYETYDQLLDYCTRSANPVGHLVLYLARAFTPENAALSDATCTALQLANFWQDVARDLDIGRVYLPRVDRVQFGYSDEDLNARRFTHAFSKLLQFEVERTRKLFDFGQPLADCLPGRLAIDIDLFTRGGRAILDRIEAQGFDVWSSRPTVGKAAKIGLLIRSLASRLIDPNRESRTKSALQEART
jgi:squalene synthase HpnC